MKAWLCDPSYPGLEVSVGAQASIPGSPESAGKSPLPPPDATSVKGTLCWCAPSTDVLPLIFIFDDGSYEDDAVWLCDLIASNCTSPSYLVLPCGSTASVGSNPLGT